MSKACIVFDLDDTLYKELDFVRSGYRYIARKLSERGLDADDCFGILMAAFANRRNAFEELNRQKNLDIPIADYLNWYRNHTPNINLWGNAAVTLCRLHSAGHKLGIITDGRETTQMNKIRALGLLQYMAPDDIVISGRFGSEKPCRKNYCYFSDRYPTFHKFVYVADNTAKDFIAPNELGWQTIGLKDNGQNIHQQQPGDALHAPGHWISGFEELENLIDAE